MKRMRAQRGFTLVEIMIVVAIIALLAAIAIPNVLRGRTTANETAAIGNLRALVSSLEMYRSIYQNYPSAWRANMYTNVNPAFGPPSFNLTDAQLTNPGVQGFNYIYAGTNTTYDFRALPISPATGSRSFLANEMGLIRHCSGPTATVLQLDDEATIDAPPTTCD
jgi:prepilin-type N-terminal cleavage/methylation domain-containing protein